ncbi:hypothetical protein ACR3FV_003119 [Yersinia enterocolitica]
MLSEEPVRIRHNWDAAVVAICDFCSHSEMTVPHVDGGKICASCCDAETLSKWQSYAQDVVSELLSLREQMAAAEAQIKDMKEVLRGIHNTAIDPYGSRAGIAIAAKRAVLGNADAE